MAYWMNGILHDPKGELTEAPELPDVVAFNIADGSFEFFTTEQFEEQIAESKEHAEWFKAALKKAEKRFAALTKVEERHANHYREALAAAQAR